MSTRILGAQSNETQSREVRAAVRNPLPRSSRYELLLRIASGGMASVYLGRLKGAAGFWKLRAIKRAHPDLAEDEILRGRLIEEAQLSSLIAHPNVVGMQDVEEVDGELLLVMDYIEGASLAELQKLLSSRGSRLTVGIALRIVLDAALGVGAAHELAGENGEPLGLVHRDVSPQNVLLGLDGLARIADFGIAKCIESPSHAHTRTGSLKGKLGYMAPEYIKGRPIDARADVFALGVVTWEILTGERLFRGPNEANTLQRVCMEPAPPPSQKRELDPAIDAVVAKALHKSPAGRYPSMKAFGEALTEAASRRHPVATHAEVGALVSDLVGEQLTARRAMVKELSEALLAEGADVIPLEARPTASTERSIDRGSAPAPVDEGTIDRSVVVTSSKAGPLIFAERTSAERTRRRRWLWLAAPAAVTLVGAAALFLRPPPPEPAQLVAPEPVAEAVSHDPAAPAPETAIAAPSSASAASPSVAPKSSASGPSKVATPPPIHKPAPYSPAPSPKPDVRPDPNPYQ